MVASKVFLYFCLCFVGGIFLNSFFNISQAVLLGFLILGIFFISVFWKKWKLVIIGFCILFLSLGVLRHEIAESKVVYPEEKEIVFSGIVVAESDIRTTNIKLTVKSKKDQSFGVYGKVLITTDRYPEYQYGDKLKIKGSLQAPPIFDEFNYKDYLKKDGIYSVMYYPEIELVKKNQGNVIYARILSFKDKLRGVIYKNLSPPQSSILGAMILGDKSQISNEWKEKLNYAGVRHLTAISGMHVAILTVALMSLLLGFGFWRQQAFYLTIILITFFIIMSGLQPSAIRAGIMAGFFLLAKHLGRISISFRAVVFAAVLMLAFNPLLLKLDLGFQLSFLAMLGIIYFLPVFQEVFRRFPDFFQLKNILAMTFSAQIFTLPILIYNFGYFSIVAPIANILIVPFLPFIMGLGFIFVLMGMVWSFLGWAFSLPVWLLLSYLVKVVELFSSFSFSIYFFEISWHWLIIYYFILWIFIWRFDKKQKLNQVKKSELF